MSKKFLSTFTYACIGVIVFLTPIFFLPWTSDLFNFNKQFLLYFVSFLALLSWAARSISEKKIELVRTPLDIPIAILLLISLVASLLSDDRYSSFWGDLTNINYGFVPLLFYAIFYFLVVNTLTTRERISRSLNLLAVSVGLSMVYFVLRAWKLLPLGAGWPSLNSVSNLSTAFGLIGNLIFIIIFSNLMTKKGSSARYAYWIPILVLIFAVDLFIGFRPVWTGLAIGLVFALIFAISKLDDMRVGAVSAAFAVMVVAILLSFLGTPRFLTAKVPGEVSLSPSVSWHITRETITTNFKHFLFGSGPATFVNDFSRHRPEDFNNNFAWNTRFLRPYSNVFELLATTGILGIIAFLILLLLAAGTGFVGWFKIPGVSAKKGLADAAREMMSRDGSTNLYFAIFAGWLMLALHLFIANFDTTHWILFFFFLGLIFAMPFEAPGVRLQKFSLKTSPQYALVSSFVTILLFIIIMVLGIYLGRYFAADIYFVKARQHGNLDRAIATYVKSTSLNPGRYQYHLGLASSYISRAGEELGKASGNAELVRELVANAVNSARRGTDLAAKNVSAWEFLATMYSNARALTNEALRFQISALEQALTLEPTNPVLHLNLGNTKLAAGNVAEARDQYKESVRLKSNFIPGYVSLAVLEEQSGNVPQAIEYMATAVQVAPNDPGTVFNLGRLYYNRATGDDLARAEQLFLYAVQLNPGYSDALYSLALIYERRGNLSEALRYYRRVLSLNPDNSDVKSKVQSLLAPAPNEKKK